MSEVEVSSYTDEFGEEHEYVILDPEPFHAICAEREGKNALILYKLDEPRKRFDGEEGQYELVYRWLSEDDDDELATVLGSESNILKESEIDLNKPLFSQFNLF